MVAQVESNILDALVQKAMRIRELDKLVIKAVIEWDIEQLGKLVDEYRELKKTIKIDLMQNPVISIPDINDKFAREVLQKVSSNQALPGEKAFHGNTLEEYFLDELDDADIEQLGMDLFYSWFSHYEYVEGLYNIGSLILSVSRIPEYLLNFIDEARQCFAFQRYTAVYSLCRTIIEIVVRDICVKHGLVQGPTVKEKPLKFFEPPELREMIVEICRLPKYKPLKERLDKIRVNANFLIHGNCTATSKEAKDLFSETLGVIQELYKQD